jgi:large subunit ribosomal protein L4e
MKANYFDVTGKKVKQVSMPVQFDEEVRPQLIKRAVLAVQANTRQAYGAMPKAGKRQSVNISRRRKDYKGSYNKGIARSPRKTMWSRGTQFGWVGAVAPNTVSGRRAHPPKAEADWSLKVNTKERKKAIRSALAATLDEKLVKKRGHKFTELPSVIDSKIEALAKTKMIIELFEKLGLGDEVERLQVKKVRAGHGKSRGRRYNKKVGPLIVVSEVCKLRKAAANIPGVQIVSVKKLNAELLAPGTDIGRLTIYTEKALEVMKTEKLFLVNPPKEKKAKEKLTPKVKAKTKIKTKKVGQTKGFRMRGMR